jgi:hypothetical protein
VECYSFPLNESGTFKEATIPCSKNILTSHYMRYVNVPKEHKHTGIIDD